MRHPLRTSVVIAVLAALAAGAVAVAAVPIYSNEMSTAGDRKELSKVGNARCSRSGEAKVLKMRIGKQTEECSFRTPVVGRNLLIVANERLLSGTPESIRDRVFIGLGLRVGNNGGYELVVFPAKGSFQLRKESPSNGEVTVLAQGRSPKVKDVNKANKLRLQAFADDSGALRLAGFVNGKQVASALESSDAAAKLPGRYSTIEVGSNKGAKGATASFDDLQVSVPNPF
ncbi:MAG: hypothetical protein AABM29_11860 [Actinomycetota bacterium]